MYNPFTPGYSYQQMPQFNNFRQPVYNQPQFIVKQVTSIEEARASIIDPLSTFLFIDTSTGRIYLKRMNNNGLSDFYTYLVEESDEAVSNPLEEINARLKNIESKLGGNHVQSISNNESKSVNAQSAPKSESTVVQQGSTNGKWQDRGGNKADGK